jgi:hypothetical protein
VQNRIKEISNFYTYFGKLQDNSPVASLLLPSNLRSNKYPNSFTIDDKTGKLRARSKVSVVPNNTVKEISSIPFRISCNKNSEFLKTLTFEEGMLWGFEYAFSEWVYALPSSYKNITIYGGEILSNKMLKNICHVLRNHEDKRMCIYTYNDKAVEYVRKLKIVPENLIIFNSLEWDYKVSDNKFGFKTFANKKFIVPVSSKNFKYYYDSTNRKNNKYNKRSIPY